MKETKFKQTEVGMIPSDWDVIKFGDFAKKIEAGVSVNSDESLFSNNYVLKTSAVHNGVVNYKEVKPVVKKDEKRLKCHLKADCLVVSRMNTPELVGECAYSEKNVDNVYLPDRLWLVPNNPKNHISFKLLNYILGTPSMRNAVKGTATGTSNSMKNISKGKFLELICALPPTIEEQQRIANALSDVDSLIANLEKLIAKKKNIKQGAMQQLLTGRKRLPAFAPAKPTYKQTELGPIPADWDVKKLSSVCTIVMGQSPDSKYYNEKSGIPLIQGNADIESRKTFVRFYTTQVTKRGLKGDLILTVRAPVGSVAKATFDCCLGRGVCALRNASDFLYQYLIYIEKEWSKQSAGSTFDSIKSEDLCATQVVVPSSKEEQTAIANILSDMDSEIQTLETKLAKYRKLKTGMMQQLLTGKIRLV